jgi:hypothetical protein
MVRLMEGEQECNNRTQTVTFTDGQITGAPSDCAHVVVIVEF